MVKNTSKMTEENDNKFIVELINYLKGSIIGSSTSVDALIKIEDDFPENYNKLKLSKIDFDSMEDLLMKMKPEDRDVFALIFFKASSISRRLNRLFDLEIEDKKELSKDLKYFSEYVDEKLNKLIKNKS